MSWKIDHIGIAVKDLESAILFYLSTPGHTILERERMEDHKVEAVFLGNEGDYGHDVLIELLAPLPGNDTIRLFLERKGQGMHHICYRVESVDRELERLRSSGVKLVDERSRIGGRGLKVAFLHPSASNSGVLVEICSED